MPTITPLKKKISKQTDIIDVSAEVPEIKENTLNKTSFLYVSFFYKKDEESDVASVLIEGMLEITSLDEMTALVNYLKKNFGYESVNIIFFKTLKA